MSYLDLLNEMGCLIKDVKVLDPVLGSPRIVILLKDHLSFSFIIPLAFSLFYVFLSFQITQSSVRSTSGTRKVMLDLRCSCCKTLRFLCF